MQPTQKMLIIVLITAIAGAGIGVGATLLLNDDDNNVAVPTPFSTFSPDVTLSPSPSPSLSPSPSVSPTAGASATPVATSSTTSTQAPTGSAPATRPAKSVNCSSEPQFCSNATGMKVSNGNLSDTSQSPGGNTDPSRYPTVHMSTKFEGPNGTTAHEGDRITAIVVDVLVENKTNRTFVFPKREVALVITKNGQNYDTLLTEGDGFEMPPGGKLRAHYERPFIADGNYRWVAKTWYYTKS